ncbi:MAG: thiosulfate oxidation carrier protein SoxY [Hyphomicrobiales bacterium]|nr:MAG: thiosulfate oxidation carrier protein SoxY [Hyphomicrobiales bacterium]
MQNIVVAPSRRIFLSSLGGAVVAVTLLPRTLSAATDDVQAEVKKLYGDKPMKEGKIKIDLPSIAENGLVVPLGFEVESPMTEQDYVKAIHFFAEGNPNPLVASFHFTPLCPKAAASIRIRLAQTQKVFAIAEMSSGELFTSAKEVKVTIGGCGG